MGMSMHIPIVFKIPSLQCLYIISIKKLEVKSIFACRWTKFPANSFQHFGHQSFLQDDAILMGMLKHSQSSQSNMFAISSQYLKKEVLIYACT